MQRVPAQGVSVPPVAPDGECGDAGQGERLGKVEQEHAPVEQIRDAGGVRVVDRRGMGMRPAQIDPLEPLLPSQLVNSGSADVQRDELVRGHGEVGCGALAALFAHPRSSTPAARAAGASRLADRDREFLRGLGQRLHAVRTARQVEPPVILRSTGIRSDQLADLERGVAAPTILALHRFAEALQVPLPLLVDHTRSPLDLLLTLARRESTSGRDDDQPEDSP